MTIRADAHKPEFHRAAPPQLPVRVASTASVTIATALNAGDTIDGVTLAAGDRVLLKDQSTGSQNGIYIAGATPARAFDFEEGVAAYGALIYVVAGTANGGHTFVCTNTTVPTIGTTALTFSDYSPSSGGAPTTADYLVGTAQAGLSAEIVVGTTPNGELGGTWGAITVDSTHSGSAHTDFIAKSLLTTQDDIIVRDGTGPARLAKGTDGQVLTVDPTTHHLVWATPASGSIVVKEGGSTVVAAATTFDFGTGFDITNPGGAGTAAVAFDASEIALDTFGATSDITTLNSSTSAHGLLKKLDNNASHYMDGTGAWSSPGGSPAVGNWTYVVQAANLDITNAVDQTTDLHFSVVANKHYAFEAMLIISGNNTTGDAAWRLKPAAGTFDGRGNYIGQDTGNALAQAQIAGIASASIGVSNGVQGTLDFPSVVRIFIPFMPSNTTTFDVLFGNAAAAAGRTSRLWAFSYIRYIQLD